ncbi:MAG: hypothetical protein ACRDF7_00785 [Candidatus Limnocylindrales bacterium]
MPSQRPDPQDDLDRDLNEIVEYLALTALTEEVNFVAAPLRRVVLALLAALPEAELSPYRRHLKSVLVAGRARDVDRPK